jgi:predicted ArsR family transcriptional regulator
MTVNRWGQRFFDTTKGRIVALLRRGGKTVDELAGALGVSDNAIRPHLAALERDGIVHQSGARPTGGKPAVLFEVVPDAEQLFSTAYTPVLTQLLTVLSEQMSAGELEDVLREVGRRLGARLPRGSGDVRARTAAAAAVLSDLGGVVDVVSEEEGFTLRGYGCPLAEAVRTEPTTCRAVETLVEEIIGQPVRERCDRGARPHCCFEVLERTA